jgi:NAD(P)-dependent dehydrogenase (short-subunit alcohol dehydrogenase family)
MPPQEGRLAIVTGANSGIGYQTARYLSRAGATVILACRNREKGEAARAKIVSVNPAAVEMRVGCRGSRFRTTLHRGFLGETNRSIC